MQKVFIAGHKGMVGSSLLRTAPAFTEIVTAERSEVDLTDGNSVLSYLSKNEIDSVILAAAKVGGIGANSRNQYDFLLENLRIQNAVIDSAVKVGVNNLVFLGSSCVYPKLAEQPINEKSLLTGPLEPTNEGYALAKIAGIRLCRAVFDEEGLNYFSLMPTNLYGPNDNFDLENSHVPAALLRKFHDAKLNGIPEVKVWGSGEPRREFMHVDDLAQATWTLVQKKLGGELINVGTGEDIAIANFAYLVARVVGYDGEITFDRTRPDGTPQKKLDVSKIHALGWRHQISLEDGIARTYEWLLKTLKMGEVRGY